MPPSLNDLVDVYVLKLEQGKFYVGVTNNWEKRQAEHLSGNGSAWTKKYRPTAVVEVQKDASRLMEDMKVKEYMLRCGIDNVRGGSYSRVELEESQKRLLEQEHRNATGLCYECGKSGHFANECPQKKKPTIAMECLRCGRQGHLFDACHAATHIDGTPIQTQKKSHDGSNLAPPSDKKNTSKDAGKSGSSDKRSVKCFRCGRENHMADSCHASVHINGTPLGPQKNSNDGPQSNKKQTSKDTGKNTSSSDKQRSSKTCFRCGREGHMVDSCHATVHINGTPLASQKNSQVGPPSNKKNTPKDVVKSVSSDKYRSHEAREEVTIITTTTTTTTTTAASSIAKVNIDKKITTGKAPQQNRDASKQKSSSKSNNAASKPKSR